jgi:hypothetical protein
MTLEAILTERAKTHGDFRNHAGITQSTKLLWRCEEGWNRLDVRQRESLEMIAHKVGRILAGDPNIADHWDDIAGYARLVAKAIEKEPAR